MLKVPLSWVSQARVAGCDGFNGKGTVALSPVRAWLDANLRELEEAGRRQRRAAAAYMSKYGSHT